MRDSYVEYRCIASTKGYMKSFCGGEERGVTCDNYHAVEHNTSYISGILKKKSLASAFASIPQSGLLGFSLITIFSGVLVGNMEEEVNEKQPGLCVSG